MKSVLVPFFLSIFVCFSFTPFHLVTLIVPYFLHSGTVSIPLENMDLLMRRRQYGEAQSSRRNNQTNKEIRNFFSKLLVLSVFMRPSSYTMRQFYTINESFHFICKERYFLENLSHRTHNDECKITIGIAKAFFQGI